MTVIDESVRTAARRTVRECAGVRAGEHAYIEGRMDSVCGVGALAGGERLL
mgnify:CR=1 FL=1